MPVSRGPFLKFAVRSLTYVAIVAVTLAAVDGICIALGLFPPTHDYGDPDLGWRPTPATGRMELNQCTEFSTGEVFRYQRNEDGIRTSLPRARIEEDSGTIRIGVTGDSQTDLCAPNGLIHSGILESALREAGLPAVVLTYGSGRYSPLQAYLAFRQVVGPYRPRALVLNLYTGNDFYDILRPDDRPHFVQVDSGYAVASPVWYALDDPKEKSVSRVLFAFRSVADRTGMRPLYLRVKALRQLGAEQGEGMSAVLAYMRNLWRARDPAVGYPEALTAQMLNQQLFFHHFPRSEEESLRRVEALMKMIRVENPDLLLVMSPIPSYELTGEQPVDSALLRTLSRLPLSLDSGRQQEGELYERLRRLSAEQNWLFVDNLAALRAARGPDRLYNDFDYHLLPPGSAVIGRAQSGVLLQHFSRLMR